MELYRYVRHHHHEFSSISLMSFKVVRETKKCYVIEESYFKNGIKYILKCKCMNKFAYETKKDALFNFKMRTIRCIKIQRSQIRHSEMFLNMCENLETKLIE